MFTLYGTTISWMENQQSMVALSTTQAEYIIHVEGVKESIWLKGMIGELGIAQECVKIHLIVKVSSTWKIIKCIIRGQSTLTFVCTLLET